MDQTDIQDLVDNPYETLDVELKDWLNLSDKVCRANIARHIAAMANHGGGYILIGFDDNCVETSPPELEAKSYDRDTINAIVKKYLTPIFQCEVTVVPSAISHISHPVIWIPGHKSVPICTQADGPHDDKGKPQGIKMATYYTRSSGPESTPINEPELWQPLIHRCVVNERESLLASITAVLAGRETRAEKTNPASDWHKHCHSKFKTILESHPSFHWNVPYLENHYQLSYRIIKDDDAALPFQELQHILEAANKEVRDLVWTGWSMFYPFTRDEIKFYVETDKISGIDIDLIETSLLGETQQPTGLPDFWRFCPAGYASLIRAYREDRVVINQSGNTLKPGEWLSPLTLIRELAEFVRHARAIGKLFPSATEVEILGTWEGLAKRHLDEFNPGIGWNNRRSRVARRDVHGRWPIGDLNSNWEEIVAELATPVIRLFDGLEVTPEWVKQATPGFRQM